MKILSYEIDGDYIRVETDNPGRPQFVYNSNKFSSIEELSREIEKSIALESLRSSQKQSRFVVLESSLKSAGAVDAKEVAVDAPN